MSGYDFDKYICKVTGLPCCGCSLFCEHREGRTRKELTDALDDDKK